MPPILNSSTPKTTSLQQASSTFPLTIQKVMHKSSSITSTSQEKMAAKNNPVEIGTKGTIGSLITQEIEYFSERELGCCRDSSGKPGFQVSDMASTISYSRPKLESMIPKKKKRGGRRLIPSMCSMVEVAESNPSNVSSGFSYRDLKADIKRLQVNKHAHF